MGTILIKEFTPTAREAWDAYVEASPHAAFFHLSGWKRVLEKTFGYKSCYLYAEDKGKIVGILPLFFIRDFFTGKALISLPFAVYGGVCSDDHRIAKLLVEEAKGIARQKNMDYLELRNRYFFKSNMPSKDQFVTFIQELPKDVKECIDSLRREARAAVRKGINSGLQAVEGLDLLKEFYDIYALNVRNLGSPVWSYRFLKNLTEEFKDNTTVLTILHKGKPVAGAFTFLFKKTVMPYWGGCLPEYFKYRTNNFMYLKLMEYGVKNDYSYVDFGRSKIGSGSYNFKKYMGFKAQPLYYQYYLNAIEDVPDVSSLIPRFRLAISIWKRMPVSLTKIIGPLIIWSSPT